jgi:hypothetical protein
LKGIGLTQGAHVIFGQMSSHIAPSERSLNRQGKVLDGCAVEQNDNARRQ